MAKKQFPTYRFEETMRAQGFQVIAGIDEAGCGALAGPVVAGAAVMPIGTEIEGLRDSKLMTERAREAAFEVIQEVSDAWAVGVASVEEIFEQGIRQATYLAMRRALEQITQADYALVDAWTIPHITISQQGIVRGDAQVVSIAAASVLAKVTRDRYMKAQHEQFPLYGFDVHKGYGTAKHRAAIEEHGPCPIHRLGYKTFLPNVIDKKA